MTEEKMNYNKAITMLMNERYKKKPLMMRITMKITEIVESLLVLVLFVPIHLIRKFIGWLIK